MNRKLADENIKLNQKVEQVCYRYLYLLDRRLEEVISLILCCKLFQSTKFFHLKRKFFKLHIDKLRVKLMECELDRNA
jgi:hypothetical protein